MKKHQDPTYSSRRAVAPYNFVSLPEKALTAPELPSHNSYELKSGFFECVFKTSSPIYIRGMQKIDLFRRLAETRPADITPADKIDRAPFYQVGGTAQIPGSSLRGLFRTLIEIISWSKPLVVSSDPLMYRSVDTTSNGIKYRNRLMEEVHAREFRPQIKAGYMRRSGGDWYIQPAVEIKGISYARISNQLLDPIFSDLDRVHNNWEHVRKIYVEVDGPTYHPVRGFLSIWYSSVKDAAANPQSGFVECVISESGRIQSKKSEAVIFLPDGSKSSPKDWIPVSDQLVYQYRENLSQQLAQFLGQKGVLQEGYPVFYLVENGLLVSFGHCQMMRLPYRHTPNDLVPPEVKVTDQPDLAEALFGYTGKSYPQGESRAGRVSFSDALCQPGQENLFLPVIRPKILSGPKPTSFQLYLTQDDPDNKNKLQDYDSDTIIRGTKIYWHKGTRNTEQIETQNPTANNQERQYTRIQPIRTGVSFQFRLYFHNLTDLELGLLGWALTIASSEKIRLKLGMGKPLGMGAVQVVKADIHLIDREARYKTLFSDQAGRVSWSDGEKPDDIARVELQKGMIEYKEWLLAHNEVNPQHFDSIIKLPRIRELLLLLNWPGPEPEKELTRYQLIRPDNEYRERPVLPTPAGVQRKLSTETPPQPVPDEQQGTQPNHSHTPSTHMPQEPVKISAQAKDWFAQLQGLDQNLPVAPGDEISLPTLGETVMAELLEDKGKSVLFLIVGQPDNVIGQWKPAMLKKELYSGDEPAAFRIISQGRKDGSDIIFDLEPIE